VADERMSGEVELYRWNLAQETWAMIDCGRETTATGARRSPGRNTTATAFNALRLIASSGNLQFDTNGAVEVFYRT
jgi:hypothetical protein